MKRELSLGTLAEAETDAAIKKATFHDVVSQKPTEIAPESHEAAARRVSDASLKNDGSLADFQISERKLGEELSGPTFTHPALPSFPEVEERNSPMLARDAAGAFLRKSVDRVVPMGAGEVRIGVDYTQEHLVETPEQAAERLAKVEREARQNEAEEIRVRMEGNIERVRLGKQGAEEGRKASERDKKSAEEEISFLKQQIADTELEIERKSADIASLTASILAQKDVVLQSAQRKVLAGFEREQGALMEERAILNRGLTKRQEEYQGLSGS